MSFVYNNSCTNTVNGQQVETSKMPGDISFQSNLEFTNMKSPLNAKYLIHI